MNFMNANWQNSAMYSGWNAYNNQTILWGGNPWGAPQQSNMYANNLFSNNAFSSSPFGSSFGSPFGYGFNAYGIDFNGFNAGLPQRGTPLNPRFNQYQSPLPIVDPPAPAPVAPPEVVNAPVPSQKVYIVGAYSTSAWDPNITLAENINEFSGQDTRVGTAGGRKHIDLSRGGTALDANDDEFQRLLSKMSDQDKNNLKFDQGQAYIISQSGQILGTVSSGQLGTPGKVSFWQKGPTAPINSSFRVLDSLGVDDDGANTLQSWSSNQEGQGGQITLNGQTYDVASTILRKHSPLAFDLDGKGIKTTDAKTNFDIDGNGTIDKINDLASGEGILSIRGGKNGRDLFGDNTDLDGDGKADGFKNGFDALKALARKEHLINDKDDMVLDKNDLQLLEKKYQLGMKTQGYNSQSQSLSTVGISEINLGKSDAVSVKNNFDGKDNTLMQQDGATFKVNQQTRSYADVWHRTYE
ncbi:MAG: hypothetical protein K2X01_02935 [Cyanobacteria bacterium]|nr:hypothetical protein [Cyanobacteriota bacterium]